MTAALLTLSRLNACAEATAWVGKRTPAKAWAECKRGDWMLWIAARLGVDRKLLVLGACDCARLSLKYVPKGEKRPLVAIETAEKWCQGKATIESVKAADAAALAAAAAAYAAAAYAAYAAAYAAAAATPPPPPTPPTPPHAAAYAAYAAAHAAAYAAYAAYADAAAYAAYAAAARVEMRIACAKAVRKRIPYSVIAAALKAAQ